MLEGLGEVITKEGLMFKRLDVGISSECVTVIVDRKIVKDLV